MIITLIINIMKTFVKFYKGLRKRHHNDIQPHCVPHVIYESLQIVSTASMKTNFTSKWKQTPCFFPFYSFRNVSWSITICMRKNEIQSHIVLKVVVIFFFAAISLSLSCETKYDRNKQEKMANVVFLASLLTFRMWKMFELQCASTMRGNGKVYCIPFLLF